MSKDTSYSRFFNPSKSPSGGFDLKQGKFLWPKHLKFKGHIAWNSSQRGTYVWAIHGPLK